MHQINVITRKRVKSYKKRNRKRFGAGISIHLLNTSNHYVMLENFTTDSLEK